MFIIRLLLIVLAVMVVAAVIRRVLESLSQSSGSRQARQAKVIDSEVRNVRGRKYFEARRGILEEVCSGRITLDEAERRLDELD
jgi:hypothetical protein